MKAKILYQIRGWLLVRPIRYLFGNMMRASLNVRYLPEKDYVFGGYLWPNFHWYFLYKTVFRFFNWLHLKAWRYFCAWGDGRRKTFPLIARLIKGLGEATAGYHVCGGACYHCASKDGDQVELSSDDSGQYFELFGTQSVDTLDGVDHQFWGITTCPKCGYSQFYQDGSL